MCADCSVGPVMVGCAGPQDKAVQSGLDRDSASFLLSIIGISNTVSRIILGYVSDRPCVNRLWVYNCALTVSGIGRLSAVPDCPRPGIGSGQSK